jgi:tetratricopeptide (TPR) repeat protein
LPLPVTLAGDKQIAGMVGGDMDRAIVKCTDLISKHSITIKPERKSGALTTKERRFYNQNEFVRWAREAWLLIGKARVWKGSLDEASMTFEYILVQFPETPMWHESNIWLARIDILKRDFVAAEDRLRAITSNRKYPKNRYFTHLLESTWADYYQKLENYSQVTKHLEKALRYAPDKDHRLRYTYILAQLKQREEKLAESNKLFNKVIRMSPSYEMSFSARVNIASNAQGLGKGVDMKKHLLKMVRDEKNKEYLDQIYYTLGNIEKKEGNIEKAIEYYQLSARSSVSNYHQKGISYLVLADYFFAKPNYTVSQAYYDSAYNSLDQDFPGYKELEIKTLNLNRLVENLNIVRNEDSLLRVASMSPRERDEIIASLIKKVRDEEDKLRREEQEGRDRFSQFQQTQRSRTPQSSEGGWYFYNQSSLSFGLSEFNMKWGRRKLEDNWRRNNKRVVTSDMVATTTQPDDTSSTPKKIIDNKSREFYLQDLPLTDSLVALANDRIQEAKFRVGEVYETLLKDYPEAIKAYERLVKRYPNGSLALPAYYNLFQIARFTENASETERYKQIIINNFPSSTYALMLSNPNFVAEMQLKEKLQAEFYQETFELFKAGNYKAASQRSTEGLELHKGSEYEPKYQFIIAQCAGLTGNIRLYKDELTKVVDLYPKTEVAKSASDIIAYLDKRELQLATGQLTEISTTGETTEISKSKVAYQSPEGEHIFIAIVPKNSPLNQLRFNLVSFNVDNYIDLNLNVGNRELSMHLELITVLPFKDKEQALDYYRKVSAEQGIMGNLTAKDYTFIIISQTNLTLFLEDKSVVDYLNFFRVNYKL